MRAAACGLLVTLGLPLSYAIPQPAAAQIQRSQACKLAVAEGFIEFRRAQFPAALALFKEAMQGSEECLIEARLGLAFTYNGLNDHKPARAEAQWVIAATDDSELQSEAYYQLGLSLYKRGKRMTEQKAEAEAAFKSAVEVSEGQHRGAIRALARLYRETLREEEVEALKQRFPDVSVRTRGEQMALMSPPPPTKKASQPTTDEKTRPTAAPPHPLRKFGTPGPWRACTDAPIEETNPEILRFGEDETATEGYSRPQKISAPNPQYTESARKRRIQGVVVGESLIDESGKVLQVRLLAGLEPELDENVLRLFCQWHFVPAKTPEAEPLACYYQLTVNFRLQ